MENLPFKVQQLADWLEEMRQSESVPWLLEGLVPAQGITIITGRQKKEGHKSWLARLMSVSMASGKPFAELKPTSPTPVWYIDREGAPKLTQEAWDMLGTGMAFSYEWTRPNLHYTSMGAFFLTEKMHVDAACRYVVEHGIKCVIVDTFAKSFIGDENDASVVGAALRGVAKIQNAGAAVVIVHHLRKGQLSVKGTEPMPDEDIRGSGALAGGYDMHLAVRRYAELDNTMLLLYGGKYAEWKAAELHWDIRSDGFVDPTTGETLGTARLKMTSIPYPEVESYDDE